MGYSRRRRRELDAFLQQNPPGVSPASTVQFEASIAQHLSHMPACRSACVWYLNLPATMIYKAYRRHQCQGAP